MAIQRSAVTLLNQLEEVIAQLEEKEYQQGLDVLSGSSVGQHIRHTLEFFICLIDGRNERVINYDDRKHDHVIESDPKMALSVIQSIIEFLHRDNADFGLTFRANYQIEGEDEVAIQSSFYRELAYNIEHAIHHMALIKIGVRALRETIKLPDYFGVASSTVRYQLKQH